MRKTTGVALSLLALLGLAGPAQSGSENRRPDSAVTFSTLITTPLPIEGLTGDAQGNLYTVGRTLAAPAPCLVWRISASNPTLEVVGRINAPCSPSGLAFNAHGDLFIADGANVLTLTPNEATQPFAAVFASGVPGTNGLAFDRDGNLWTGDGTTGLGRVWRISPAGLVKEVFRVQPMRNPLSVGRQAVTFGPAPATGAAQDLVANGVAFTESGDLLVADTARGALWEVSFDSEGELENRVGCDTTFTENTLCLDSIAVEHAYLEGADGIALDRAGNVYVDANERNAVVITRGRRVGELFRNPASATTSLRNGGPVEFPTSPFLLGHMLCTASSDGNRRDNAPNTAGELPASGRGKISCMDQRLNIPGLPLPIE